MRKLLWFAVMLLVIAWAINFAVALIRPVVTPLLIIGAVATVGYILWRIYRRRNWW